MIQFEKYCLEVLGKSVKELEDLYDNIRKILAYSISAA